MPEGFSLGCTVEPAHDEPERVALVSYLFAGPGTREGATARAAGQSPPALWTRRRLAHHVFGLTGDPTRRAVRFPTRVPAAGRTAVVPFDAGRISGAKCLERKLLLGNRCAGFKCSLLRGGRVARQQEDGNASADCTRAGGPRPDHLTSVAQATAHGNPLVTCSIHQIQPSRAVCCWTPILAGQVPNQPFQLVQRQIQIVGNVIFGCALCPQLRKNFLI